MFILFAIVYVLLAVLMGVMFYSMYHLQKLILINKFIRAAHEVLDVVIQLDIKRFIDPTWRLKGFINIIDAFERDKWFMFRVNPATLIKDSSIFDPGIMSAAGQKVQSIIVFGTGKDETTLVEGIEVRVLQKGGKRARVGVVQISSDLGFYVKVAKRKIVKFEDIEKIEIVKGKTK